MPGLRGGWYWDELGWKSWARCCGLGGMGWVDVECFGHTLFDDI